MVNESVKIIGDPVSLHYDNYLGVPHPLRKGEQQEYIYYLHAEKLIVGAERGTEIKDVKIPITKEQYRKLEKQFKDSKAECPKFVLIGDLEITVESVCIN